MKDEFLRQELESNFKLDLLDSEDRILEKLTERIIWLLINDLTALWNILYRIDVNEQKAKALFHQNDPKRIAPGLSELIIERLKQKVLSRKMFRKDQD